MEKTFVWTLTNFSSRYESSAVTNPADGSRTTVTTLLSPYPTSEIFTTDYGSFTAQWMVKLVPGEHSPRRRLESVRECWNFHLELVGAEANSVNSEPPPKKKIGFGTNVEINVKCRVFFVNPKEDDGNFDEPSRFINPRKDVQFSPNYTTTNLGWPRYARYSDDPTSSSDEEGDYGMDEHDVCLVAKKIHNHKDKWVNAANDTLHVRVHVEFFGVERTSQSLSANFFSDMAQILCSGAASDVVIKCGPDSFPVHKLILSLRSPVLKRMLQADMKEAASSEIKIEDCDPFVLKQFLTFLYTAKVDLDNMGQDKVIGLIAVADKYDVLDLKHYCFKHLLMDIYNLIYNDKESSGKLAVAAYLHGAEPHHKSLIYEYISMRWKDLGAHGEFQTLVKAYPAAFLKPETTNL